MAPLLFLLLLAVSPGQALKRPPSAIAVKRTWPDEAKGFSSDHNGGKSESWLRAIRKAEKPDNLLNALCEPKGHKRVVKINKAVREGNEDRGGQEPLPNGFCPGGTHVIQDEFLVEDSIEDICVRDFFLELTFFADENRALLRSFSMYAFETQHAIPEYGQTLDEYKMRAQDLMTALVAKVPECAKIGGWEDLAAFMFKVVVSNPPDTKAETKNVMARLRSLREEGGHDGYYYAAFVYMELLRAHPFCFGNGRTMWILLQTILMQEEGVYLMRGDCGSDGDEYCGQSIARQLRSSSKEPEYWVGFADYLRSLAIGRHKKKLE